MENVTLNDGGRLPVLGLGTWEMGGGRSPDSSQDAEMTALIRDAIEMGYTHIDTAEMYGVGHCEELVGRALQEFDRDEIFLTTKVLPDNLRHDDLLRALDGSLKRLQTDYADLYLIHWPNPDVPLEESFAALNKAAADGRVKRVGVSNFDPPLLRRAQALCATPVVTDQVRYNLHTRKPEENGLLRYCQEKNIILTAYSPLKDGVMQNETVQAVARKHGARLHVLHLTTGDELHLFEPGAVENKRITAEVCVHHLVFAEEDYAQHGGRIKCNPSIKTSADREALRQALRENQIDVIATDHAPHLLSEKEGDYREVAAGLPFVQHALPMVLELAHQGMLELPEAVHKVAHAPALCYGVRERGFLREGYFADLTLVDLSGVWPVQPEEVLHQVGWSAFEGQQLHARIDRTWVSGQLAYAEGRVTPEALGQRLEFDHAY